MGYLYVEAEHWRSWGFTDPFCSRVALKAELPCSGIERCIAESDDDDRGARPIPELWKRYDVLNNSKHEIIDVSKSLSGRPQTRHDV